MSPAVKRSVMLFNVKVVTEKVITVKVWGQKSECVGTKKKRSLRSDSSTKSMRELGPRTDFLHFIPDPQMTGRQAGESGEEAYACLSV